MRLATPDAPIFRGSFIKRPNRFIAHVALEDGQEIIAHVPNTGRMAELLVPGAAVQVAYNPAPNRKTDYTLLTVCYNGVWVCIFATMANALAAEYMAGLEEVSALRREVTYKKSRFDLGFTFKGKPALFEVKSANLVVDETAMFPDAPTTRGSKHLLELMDAQQQGYYTGVLFVIQRGDAKRFTPNAVTDPDFAHHLVRCHDLGMDIRAIRCDVQGDSINIDTEIPIGLFI